MEIMELTRTSNEIVHSRLNEKMCFDIPEQDVIGSFIQIIGSALVESGQQVQGETTELRNKNVLIYAQLCASDILNNHSHLTVNEIRIAVKNGIRGRYGEYYGINPVSISKFLEGYQNSQERAAAIEAINRQKATKQLTEKAAATIQERFDMIKDGCIAAFETYKTKKTTLDLGNNRFLFLRKIGLLNLTPQEEKTLQVDAEHIVNLVQMSKAELSSNYLDAKLIIKSLKNQDEDYKTMVQIERRNKALELYFKNLITHEIELNDLFTEQYEELLSTYKATHNGYKRA